MVYFFFYLPFSFPNGMFMDHRSGQAWSQKTDSQFLSSVWLREDVQLKPSSQRSTESSRVFKIYLWRHASNPSYATLILVTCSLFSYPVMSWPFFRFSACLARFVRLAVCRAPVSKGCRIWKSPSFFPSVFRGLHVKHGQPSGSSSKYLAP